jgi:phosphatidylserine/phosphatidylglycerophosphate/cardiolipin synthase-like enzyme
MASFITTKEISSKIESIIKNAKKKIIIVSPYLQISKNFCERLKDASRRGVNIKIIFGKENLKDNEFDMLSNIDNLELFFYKELHAKCYFNEKDMVITSMNFYEFSEINNREMGIFIERNIDSQIFNDAIEETKSIINSSDIFQIKINGVCIRCRCEVEFNPDFPLCRDCFDEWNYWKNWSYIEQFCHCCGINEMTTKMQPLCIKCNQKFNFKSKVEIRL